LRAGGTPRGRDGAGFEKLHLLVLAIPVIAEKGRPQAGRALNL